jgi:hypothetical protein
MTTVYTVVGQHRMDRGLLLLRGEDHQYYAYARSGRLSRVELNPAWILDSDDQPAGNADAVAAVPGSVTDPARSEAGDDVAGHALLESGQRAWRPMFIVLTLLAVILGSPLGG